MIKDNFTIKRKNQLNELAITDLMIAYELAIGLRALGIKKLLEKDGIRNEFLKNRARKPSQ